NAVTATLPTGSTPTGLAVTADGKFIYVANSGEGTVSKIDTQNNSVTTFAAGTSPTGVAVDSARSLLYVTDGNRVRAFSTLTNSRVGSDVALSAAAQGLSFNPASNT